MSLLRFSVSLLTLVALAACTPKSESPPAGKPSSAEPAVYVVNYPLRYFAERIGGAAVRVKFPAPADGDPAFWKPDAETVVAYQKADLILLNGAGYAKWVERATLPQTKLVDTSSGFSDRYIVEKEAVTHSHGPEGKHSHSGTAFTTWLDMKLAVEHARAVRDAFIKLLPAQKIQLEEKFQALELDLLGIEKNLRELTARNASQALLGSHPVYQYLTRAYGLNLKSVHWEPDAMPDAAAWDDLKKLLKTHPAKWMLWEDKPLPETAAKLRELGVGSIVFRPCGNAPPEGDFLEVLRKNIANLGVAYGSP